MKVSLISPRITREAPKHKHKPIFPPLSILTVAALTPPDVGVEIVDEDVQAARFDTDADLVGITASTASVSRAYDLADEFRRHGKTVVMGGVHATALPDEAASHADAVVIGEAEGKWQRVISDFKAGSLQRFYADDDYPDPESIPSPRRDLIDHKRYILGNTAQATRGCPFACHFCSVSSFFGRTYRTRPVSAVVREVENLPGKLLMLVDDNIMGHPEYARQLFTGLRHSGKRWLGQASVSMLKHPELIKLAAQSGCSGLFVGMETLSDVTLSKIGKSVNQRENYDHLIKLLHDNGIFVLTAFVFGFDDDDESVFDKTIDFVQRAKVDAAQFTILTPFPGTQIHEMLTEQNRIIDTDWSHYDCDNVVFKPARMKPETLMQGFIRTYQEVYSYSSILDRLGRPGKSNSLAWFLNITFRNRVIRWVKDLQEMALVGI